MTKSYTRPAIGDYHTVLSKDGTNIAYLSVGDGPAVIVLPGVLSMASDYTNFACALAQRFTTLYVVEIFRTNGVIS